MDALRPLLQPVTHNLPSPLRHLGTSLIGPACYKTLVLDIDPSDSACLGLAISKGLGLGIVAASSIVKIPQILKLVGSRSAAGVSFLAYLLETAAYLIALAYNVRSGFPFSTYGETALILAQNVVICLLVLSFGGNSGLAPLLVALLAGAVALLFFADTIVDMAALSYLQAGAGVLGVASKMPQIMAIWQQGGTGQLSAFTVFNYLAGSLVRIFTTLQEVDDDLILYGFISGFLLNAVLALQMLYYWNTPSSWQKAKTKGTKAPVSASSPATRTYASVAATPPKGPTTRRRG
ncbi:hypothetical protein CDD81_7842 [Ophiocordyceps australis]|uniref:Mannose-P-dolichol utilization defect 1 protein homolog n=1 Tax=Ophiocordyceps australis TaxID=1399860 RepID=A0A2C5XBK9_9HYPO|nr:hypothetical protein CDD81_7842 [Ophiocordyceps australis]